jgi:hypothetical protein
MSMKAARLIFLVLLFLLLRNPITNCESKDKRENPPDVRVPILLYHRFGPVVSDSMTVTTAVFRSHLEYLRKKGYTVIPLRQLVDYYLRKGTPPPPRSVVIVADDAHKSFIRRCSRS